MTEAHSAILPKLANPPDRRKNRQPDYQAQDNVWKEVAASINILGGGLRVARYIFQPS